jgi:ABC-2 type transport system permease protein
MRNLLTRLGARHRVLLAASALLLGAFELALCAVVANVDVGGAVEQALAFAPPALQAMIQQEMLGGTDAGILAFGWNHPIAHALGAAVAITLAARAIAGEIEGGTMELVLAQPVSRLRYLSAHVAFAAAALAGVALAGVLATAVGQRVFGLEPFPIARLGVLLLSFFLLQAALYAVTLAFSAFGREAGRVALAGFGVALFSYLLQVLATLWPAAAFLEPYSLHTYYDPQEILMDGVLGADGVAVLGGVALVGVTVAAWRFRTRDLP